MSRLDELKKQYPELNITIFDMMSRLDTSKTYKYLPLMCKIFSKRFDPEELWHKDDYLNHLSEIQANLINKGISTDNLTDKQMFYMGSYLCDHFSSETYHTLKEFMEYMDKGLIENKDVTSYKDIDAVRGAVSLALIKEYTKDLEGHVIKEYEDEMWLAVRPLTFSASAKYGASTRWCTTYQREKQYFEKYWRRGILVYFLNKKTGYKFAGYKGLMGDSEFSFWNSEDTRIDYLDVNADDYLFPIVRNIFKSIHTNKNLCSDEIQEQVHKECIESYEKMRVEFVSGPDETIPLDEQPIRETIMEQPTPTNHYATAINTLRELLDEVNAQNANMEIEQVQIETEIRELRHEITRVPTMRA
jgi:hypothetical protein